LNDKSNYQLLLIISTLLIINIGLKSVGIGQESLWLDEAHSYRTAQHSFIEIIKLQAADNNPPLYFLLLRSWLRLTGGNSEIVIRYLSLLASVATAAVIFSWFWLAGKPWAGWWAALLFTFTPILLYFAHEARNYAVTGLLLITSYLFAYQLLTASITKNSYKWAAALAVCNGLILYSHFTAVFALVGQGLGAIVAPRKKWLAFIVAQAGAVLLFLPWLPFALKVSDSRLKESWIKIPDVEAVKQLLTAYFQLEAWGIGLLLLLLLLAAWFYWRRRVALKNDVILFSLISGLVILPIVCVYWVSVNVGSLWDLRYMAGGVMGVVLIIGLIISQLPKVLGLAAGLLLIILQLNQLPLAPSKGENWRDAVSCINLLRQQSNRCVIWVQADYQLQSFAYYYNRRLLQDPNQLIPALAAEKIYGITDSSSPEMKTMQYQDQIILVQSHAAFTDSGGGVVQQLEHTFAREAYFRFAGIEVTQFSRRAGPLRANGFDFIIDNTVFTQPPVCLDSNDTRGCNRGISLNEKQEFSPSFELPASQAPLFYATGRIPKIHISFDILLLNDAPLPQVVFEMVRDTQKLNWQAAKITKDKSVSKGQWIRQSVVFNLPILRPSNSVYKVYFWNLYRAEIQIKDWQIHFE
jgi:hypothetical protein